MKARTKILVLSEFQRWFLITFVVYTATFLFIFGLGLFFWSRMLLAEVMNLAGLLSATFVKILQRHVWIGLGVTVIFLFLLLAAAALQALFFSRRIAGPIFALARHLEKCEAEGKMQPFQLRKGDLFEDLATKFNRLVEKVNQPPS